MIASRDAHFLEDVERDKRIRGEATIKKAVACTLQEILTKCMIQEELHY